MGLFSAYLPMEKVIATWDLFDLAAHGEHGMVEDPGWVTGFGAIDPDYARWLASAAESVIMLVV